MVARKKCSKMIVMISKFLEEVKQAVEGKIFKSKKNKQKRKIYKTAEEICNEELYGKT